MRTAAVGTRTVLAEGVPLTQHNRNVEAKIVDPLSVSLSVRNKRCQIRTICVSLFLLRRPLAIVPCLVKDTIRYLLLLCNIDKYYKYYRNISKTRKKKFTHSLLPAVVFVFDSLQPAQK